MFLEQFFPAAKTSELRREIQGITQGYNETLSQYWSRYNGLLDACPNHHLLEAEVYSIFYEGMNGESKDLVNSASGGSFFKLRVSEAKRVMGRLLHAKRTYDDPRALSSGKSMANAVAGEDDDRLESRIDKLEKVILMAIEKNNPQVPPVKANTVIDQADHYPNTTGFWNSNRNWNPGRQEDAPWREHPNFRWEEGNSNQPQPSWSRRNPQDSYPPNPYPNATYVSPYQMGYQSYQYHSPQHFQNSPSYDPNQYHHSNQFSHYPPYQNQPNQPRNPYCEGHLPNWSRRNQPNQNFQPYRSQPESNQSLLQNFNRFSQCLPHQDQPNRAYHPHLNTPYDPHHQKDPNRSPSPSQHGRSIEEVMGEMLASQQNMRSYLQSNSGVVQGVQNTYREHKANMDKMSQQVSQLANSIKEMKENSRKLPLIAREPELKISPGEYNEGKGAENALVERSCLDETKLVAEPHIYKAPGEEPREITEVPDEGMKREGSFAHHSVKQRKKEESIDHFGKPEVTLLCLQVATLPPFGKYIKELTAGRTVEDSKQETIKLETLVVQEETSSPEADVQKKQDKEERHDQEGKRNDKSAARRIINRKLERWPKLIKSKDPSNHHLRPMEKRKIKGTFKNHKKKRATTLMMYQQRNPLEEGTEGEEEHLYCAVIPPKLISWARDLVPLDPAEFANEAVKLQGSNPNSRSFLENGHRVKVFRDSLELCVVEEIPLRIPMLSSN